jgi:hypothetical protein
MAQSQAQKQLQKYDADIAVLQVEFRNLDSKFDASLADVKADVKEVSEKLDKHNEGTHSLLREFQATNVSQHYEMAAKIAGLEKWRWMLIGAGCVLGGLGYSGIESLMAH